MTHDGREWARGWSARIGRAVKRVRLERGMSQQDLSDETERLGYPTSRNTVVNIEGGRSETVTVQQLAILAAALWVAPVELAYEIGGEGGVPAIPGEEVDPFYASEWFSGRAWLYEHPYDADPAPVLAHWRFHADLMDEHDWLRATLTGLEGGLTHSELQRRLSENERLIQTFRAGMRRGHMEPPPLPPDYAHLDMPPRSRLASPSPAAEIQWGAARGEHPEA